MAEFPNPALNHHWEEPHSITCSITLSFGQRVGLAGKLRYCRLRSAEITTACFCRLWVITKHGWQNLHQRYRLSMQEERRRTLRGYFPNTFTLADLFTLLSSPQWPVWENKAVKMRLSSIPFAAGCPNPNPLTASLSLTIKWPHLSISCDFKRPHRTLQALITTALIFHALWRWGDPTWPCWVQHFHYATWKGQG